MTKEMEKTTNTEPKEVAKGFFTPGFFLAPQNFFNTNPFELMKEFTKEMDKAFEGFGLEKSVGWKPAMEVFTKEGKYFIRAELPGMTKEDVKVELEGNKLIIRGERKKEHKEEKEGYYRSEVNYGEFYRSILLPEEVKFEEIEAKFNNGILEVIMPVPEVKKVEPKAKEVPIGETAKAAKV
ncbi:MAG: Hsp20/alpha crystallin family protein [Blastocatellia bacterium]